MGKVEVVEPLHRDFVLALRLGRNKCRNCLLPKINLQQDEAEQLHLCGDGVPGFGQEDVTRRKLGGDFFLAGCYKWFFGLRDLAF